MSGKAFVKTDEDIRLGNLLRISRIKMGMSQKDLSQKIGISFQQIQKYECGDNRLSVSRLIDIARALDMSISQILAETDKSYAGDKKMRDLISHMYTLPESKRELIYSMVKELTNGTQPRIKKAHTTNK